jgi:type II secretory pathway pseudopilin PulG
MILRTKEYGHRIVGGRGRAGGRRQLREGGGLKGFTVLEMLIVMLLMSTVGLVLVAVFMRSLRSSGRNVIMERLESEGGLAMERIVEWARDAKYAELEGTGCNTPVGVSCSGVCSLVIETLSREDVEINCIGVGGGVGRVVEVVDGTSSDLTSGNVDLTGCDLSCEKEDYFKPGILRVRLTLEVGGGQSRAEERAETTLEQSVVMTNF